MSRDWDDKDKDRESKIDDLLKIGEKLIKSGSELSTFQPPEVKHRLELWVTSKELKKIGEVLSE